MPKAFFIDTTRCTACRGCQIACKEWKELPVEKTEQKGSHQNPPDLSASTYKLVRFNEHLVNKKVEWYFFPDQCRHCIEPPCLEVASEFDAKGSVIQDEKSGAVIFTDESRKLESDEFDSIREACPYNIPRRDKKNGLMHKCNMCIDRVQNNILPICVKTCATGTMNFGEHRDMLSLARKRLAGIKKEYPKAKLIDPDDVRVIYLIVDDDYKYLNQ